MANSLSTSVAQKLNITCFRGEKFELTINVKNADGTDYDFTTLAANPDTTDTVRMIITDLNGRYPVVTPETGAGTIDGAIVDDAPTTAPAASLPANDVGLASSFSVQSILNNNTTAAIDGKITISAGTGGMRLWPGTYKYHILTRTPTQAITIWLYGKLIVKAINSDINQSNWG